MAKIGRNDPCPCGSGKKYKKCHPGEYDSGIVFQEEVSTYPLVICLVNDDYEDLGLATIIMVRAIPDTDRFVIGVFLCDIFCLGVKDILFETIATLSRVENVVKSKSTLQSFDVLDYQAARDIIIGSVNYAHSLGFDPCPSYNQAKFMLEPAKPLGDTVIDFGVDNKPFYITGPNDNYQYIFETLEAEVGKGNFNYQIDSRSGFFYVE